MCWRAPSRAASMRRPPCPSLARCQAGATNLAEVANPILFGALSHEEAGMPSSVIADIAYEPKRRTAEGHFRDRPHLRIFRRSPAMWRHRFGRPFPKARSSTLLYSRSLRFQGTHADAAQNRSARYGAGSENGVAPVIMSAISRPVTGPSVSPQWAWPKASHRPACPGARPITGSESGKFGRAPSQGSSSAARRAETARAPPASAGRTAPASAPHRALRIPRRWSGGCPAPSA